MFEFEQIAVDPLAVEEGVWATYLGGSAFKLRRPGAAYRQRLVELYRESGGTGDNKDDTSVEAGLKALDIYRRAAAEHLLVDWKGVSENGVEVPYSQERAYAILSNPRYMDFHDFVENFVNNRENYRAKTDQEVADTVKDSAVS